MLENMCKGTLDEESVLTSDRTKTKKKKKEREEKRQRRLRVVRVCRVSPVCTGHSSVAAALTSELLTRAEHLLL